MGLRKVTKGDGQAVIPKANFQPTCYPHSKPVSSTSAQPSCHSNFSLLSSGNYTKLCNMSTFGGSPGHSFTETGSIREGFFRTPRSLRSLSRGATTPPKVRSQLPPTSSLLGLGPKSVQYPPVARAGVDYTVTVFGFPMEYKDEVLDRFRFGEIENESQGPGNYFNVSYRYEDDMRKALALNGAVMFDNCMIAVRPRKDEEPTERITSSQPPELDDLMVRSQYYRRPPRQQPSFWEKFLEHFLNWD